MLAVDVVAEVKIDRSKSQQPAPDDSKAADGKVDVDHHFFYFLFRHRNRELMPDLHSNRSGNIYYVLISADRNAHKLDESKEKDVHAQSSTKWTKKQAIVEAGGESKLRLMLYHHQKNTSTFRCN